MKRLMIILILFTCIWACSEDKFDAYDAGYYIYMEGASATDSVDLSFFNYPDMERVEIPVYVSYAGKILTGNKVFKLTVNQEKTTAKAENYLVPDEFVFRAGFYTDTVKITLVKTTAIENTKVRLVLNLEATSDFQVGQEGRRETTILFTAKKDKPLWWNANITENYLGEYSEAKFTEFVRATKVHDLTGMKDEDFRYYALMFKYYLQEVKDRTGKPIMDGLEEMQVPILG